MNLADTFCARRVLEKMWRLAVGGAVVLSTLVMSVSLQADDVVFEEDFTLRPGTGVNLVGLSPNITNSSGATYALRRQFNGPNPPYGDAKINPLPVTAGGGWGATGLSGQALKLGTSAGVNSFLWLKHQFNLVNPIKIELTATMEHFIGNKYWDGFSIGMTSADPIGNFFNDYVTMAINAQGPQTNDIEFRAGSSGLGIAPTDIVEDTGTGPFDFVDTHNFFYKWHKFELEYDPALAVQGLQPWTSMKVNDVVVPVPTTVHEDFQPLTQLTGFGVGSRYGSGGIKFISDFKVEQNALAVVLDGDFNLDGFVGQSDLNFVLSNWGLAVPPGSSLADFNNDGMVGQDDLNAILSSWGQGQPEVAAVPEPASVVLFGLAGLGLVAIRVRRLRNSK